MELEDGREKLKEQGRMEDDCSEQQKTVYRGESRRKQWGGPLGIKKRGRTKIRRKEQRSRTRNLGEDIKRETGGEQRGPGGGCCVVCRKYKGGSLSKGNKRDIGEAPSHPWLMDQGD